MKNLSQDADAQGAGGATEDSTQSNGVNTQGAEKNADANAAASDSEEKSSDDLKPEPQEELSAPEPAPWEDEAKVEMIAAVVHTANAQYCKSIGDNEPAIPSWNEEREIIKDSIRSGVIARMKNPIMTPKQNHEAWMKYKQEEGWIYGEVKSIENKTHPCMVPYGSLPIEQRKKDALFCAIVTALM